jgi:hypothetical protein
MREVSEMPEEGQFVAVWEYHGRIWCDTYLVIDVDPALVSTWDNQADDWGDAEPVDVQAFNDNPSKFYVID